MNLPQASAPASGRPAKWACALLVLAAGLVAYLNSLSGVFLFDDNHAIPSNPHIRHLWPITYALSAPAQSTLAGRPLVSLSLAVNYAIGELNTRGYHIFNLIVHLLAALTLFGIVHRTLLLPRMRASFGRHATALALISALLWELHPLQTESVTYIVQRTESMMGLFYLLTLYCVIRGFTATRESLWRVLAVASCALGMTCKEVMVTAPLTALLLDRIFLSESFRDTLRRRTSLYIGLASCWLILAALVITGSRSASVGFGHGVGPFDYALNQCVALATYLHLSVWPHPLVLDYGPVRALSVSEIYPYGLLVVGLLIASILSLLRKNAAGFLGFAFFAILAPTSSFVPIVTEVAAERRMYLPLAAVVILVVCGTYALLSRLARRLSIRDVALHSSAGCAAAMVALTLAYLTIDRNRLYQNEEQMWRHTLAVEPDNARVFLNLGQALVARGAVDEGIVQYRRALQLDPAYPEARYNLGNALQTKGDYAQAVTQYERALNSSPAYTEAYMNRGVALVYLGKIQEAISNYEQALVYCPPASDLYCNYAFVLAQNGRDQDAMKQLEQALRLDPFDYKAHYNVGLLMIRQGRLDEAIAHWHETLRLVPEHVLARRSLAGAYLSQNRWNEAAREFREVLEIDPGDVQARAGLDQAMTRLKGGTPR